MAKAEEQNFSKEMERAPEPDWNIAHVLHTAWFQAYDFLDREKPKRQQ